jgi:RNA polymerase sigma-54 factor
MKQALQLRLGQHLTMTPQLQQAIRLLQLSTMELQTEIQEALDSNLMLELDEDSGDADEHGRTESTPAAEGETSSNEDGGENLNETSAAGESDIPEDLPVDSSWDDIYDTIATATSSAATSGSDNREFEFSGNTEESLHEHLSWQMQMTPFSDTDRAIAEFIIDAINDDGYLSMSLEDIHQALAGEQDIEIDEIEAVLHRIQNFDPPGVGARDLKESLLLQIKQYPLTSSWLKPAQELIEKHFDLLANREYMQLSRRLKISEEELKQILHLIQSLNPRPGSQITASQPEYIIPDVIVSKHNGKWKVELNPDAAPRLRVNPHYASLIKQVHNSEDNTYLKNHLQEARWFIKSLLSRNETLLKVATSIVERQIDFLEHGEESMKALVLHDIAEAVGMHESTISRVTSKKYMHTPRGIFELKYFFSSHVSTSNGGECSATAIRALIKKLIAAENTNKPLSDSKLAAILGDQGINVARRTVAKYREAMAIPPSNERKRLA